MRNSFLNLKIPRVFKLTQQYLGIEKEWATLKSNLYQHKYKVTLLTSILTYPLYQPYLSPLKSYIQSKIAY